MRLDPSDPFDVYFALRLAFVDRPEVRIRTQERMATPDPRGRFAPDPALWSVDAYARVDQDEKCCLAPTDVDLPCSPACPRIADPMLYEKRLTQPGTLDGGTPTVGESAMLARMLYDEDPQYGHAAVYAGELKGMGFVGAVLAGAA